MAGSEGVIISAPEGRRRACGVKPVALPANVPVPSVYVAGSAVARRLCRLYGCLRSSLPLIRKLPSLRSPRSPVLHICIPVYNEAPTVGVLLWRIRQLFQEFSREYELTVYDDGSSDATAEVLEPYSQVMPLTVLRGETRCGTATAIDTLLRSVATRTRYPRRDAAVVMQADLTDQPEHLIDMVKRFEGGADLVVAQRSLEATPSHPTPVRRLQRVAPWVLRPFVSVPNVRDPFRSFRLYRIQLLRDLISEAGDGPLMRAEGWAGNVDLLLRAMRHARRMETIELSPRYDLRPRESRVRPWDDAVSLYRFGRGARSRRVLDSPLRTANSP